MAVKKKNKKAKKIAMLTAGGVILLVEIVMIVVLVANSARGVRDDSPVHGVLTVEAGEAFDLSSFLKEDGDGLTVSTESKYNTALPGNYPLELHLSDGRTAEVTLKVRDTLPPACADLPPLIVKRGVQLKAEMLMPQEFISDATGVKVSFISSSVSTAREGRYSATLRLIDGGGNITKVSRPYFVREDYNADYYYEIGDPAPEPEDILPGASVGKWESLDFTPSVPSFVTVWLTMHGREYYIRYEAKDTVAPSVTLKEGPFIFEEGGSLPDPMAFIERIVDNTEVKVTYDQDYLLDRTEQKRINLIATDLGGNVTNVSVTISVVSRDGEDTTPPMITGAKDLVTEPGVRPDYLNGITVYDSRDGVIPTDRVRVDDSRVNYSIASTGPGYEVIYTVSDSAGNRASVTIYVKIVQNVLPDSELDKFFDGIVAEMGSLEGLKRITVLGRVYTLLARTHALTPGPAHTNLTDLRREAYWGFKLGTGDSDTACAMLSVILDRIGVDCIKVERSAAGSGRHTFMLIDYGFGWLYMDVMPTSNYVWTADGRLLRADSFEAKALTEDQILRREELTDEDLERLNDLSNSVTAGWNYYRLNKKDLPPTASRQSDGSYRSPSYAVYYKVNNTLYGSITGQAMQNVEHGGESASVTAVAVKGYKFVDWSDGVTTATRSDVITRESQFEARFAPDSQTFTYYEIRYEADAGGRIEGEAVQSVLYGNESQTVTARPDGQHYFDKWSDGLTAPSRRDTVTGKVTYTAYFLPRAKLVYTAEEGGTIEGAAEQYLIPGTQGSVVRALPDRGYIFTGWSDGVLTPERRDRGTEGLAVSAIFVKDTSSYTVTYVAGEGGAIEGTAQQTVVCFDRTEPVTALPLEGYVFAGWSDGETEPTRSDAVYENMTCEALFTRVETQTYTVTYLATDGGAVKGDCEQTVAEGAFTAPVTAAADEGYVFAGWSDGNPEAGRSDAVTGDACYIAQFVKADEEE